MCIKLRRLYRLLRNMNSSVFLAVRILPAIKSNGSLRGSHSPAHLQKSSSHGTTLQNDSHDQLWYNRMTPSAINQPLGYYHLPALKEIKENFATGCSGVNLYGL